MPPFLPEFMIYKEDEKVTTKAPNLVLIFNKSPFTTETNWRHSILSHALYSKKKYL